MADDLSTLSLRLTNAQAIADAKATGAAFEDMGVKGEAAQKKLVAFSNPVTEAIKKQAVTIEQSRAAWAASGGDMHKFALELKAIADSGSPVPPVINQVTDSTRKMTLAQIEAIAINEKMSAGNIQHKLTLGRLGNQFESLIGQIAGVPPVIGKAATVMGEFAIGNVLTVGVLAGLAAIAFAYDKLTESSRKSMEVADKTAESYNRAAHVASLGIGGQQKADIEDLNKGLEQHNKWLGFIIAARIRLGSMGGLLGSDPGGHSAAIATDAAAARAAEQQRVNAIGLQDAQDNEAWAARIKDANEKALAAAAKAQADLIRYTEMMARIYGTSSDGMTSAQRASWLSSQHGRGMSDSERTQAMGSFGIGAVPDASMPTAAIKQLLNSYDVKHAEVVKQLTQAYEDAKQPFRSVTAAVGDFKDGLKRAATGLLDQLSPSNLAQGLLTGAVQQVEGWVHSLVSTVVGGIRHAFFGESGAEKDAARQAADSARAMALGLDAVTMSLQGNVLGATINALQISLISTLQAINSALPGTKNEAERNKARALAASQEAQQEAQARRAAAEQIQYANEDLVVRNLRATGQGSQADLLAFQNQQAREMQAAIDANRDATFLSYLATVQNNELIAYQNGLLATAIRNSPSGGFGIEGYLGQFATPFGPPGYPTDSGSISGGGGADNSNGGLTPPGGRSGSQGRPRGDIHIALTVDGRVLTRTVVSSLDQEKAATGGTGSTRSQALESFR